MNQIIYSCLTWLNNISQGFCNYAASIFIQSSILIILLLIIDFLIRKRIRAAFRYCLWMLVFVKLILPPSLSLPTGIGYWLGDILPAKQTISETIQNITVAESIFEPVAHGTSDLSNKPLSLDESRATSHESLITDNEPVSSLPEITWQAVVFVLWLVGIFVISVLLIQRIWFVRRLIARSEPATNRLTEILNQCVRQVGIGRKIKLRLSHNVSSPAVCGLFKPTILLPTTLDEKLSLDRLRAVLIHELAHIKRGDLWISLVQTILQIIYFYNPFVWLVNAVVRRIREQAVDEMVLVALGAEAKSYSNTLIDIAEMAFTKPRLSLRLIGVVESKKALHRRIIHMLNRPIPKSAKIGTLGLLTIIIMAALLLPMAAAANKEKEEKVSQFSSTLPNGVTIDLIGICSWSKEGRSCWRPDGLSLAEEIYATKGNKSPGAGEYGFMFKVNGPEDLNFSWNKIEGASSWEGSCKVVDAQDKQLAGFEAAISDMKEGQLITTIRIGIAARPWVTIASHDGKRMNIGKQEGVLWSQAFEARDGTHIVASTQWHRDRAERVIAIDKNGKLHTTGHGSVASGNVDQLTASFRGLKLHQIKEFQYQTRPYDWVTIGNVSLQPGQQTDVQVQVGSDEKMDYSAIVVEEGIGFGDIIVGDVNCTGEFIKSILGQPDKETKDEKTGWWLSYRKTYGLDFWINLKENVLLEIRLNEGFKGKLTSGISLASTKEDVFNTYGRPVEEKTVSDLTKHFDNQVLYQRKRLLGKPQNSKIFYTHHGLLFWFEGDKIQQFVIHQKDNYIARNVPELPEGIKEMFELSKDDVLQKFGQPENIFYGDQQYTLENLPKRYYMCFEDLSFHIYKDSIVEITLNSPRYVFGNGIRVGDSEAKVLAAFGPDYTLKESEVKDFIEYEHLDLSFEIYKPQRKALEIGIGREYGDPALLQAYARSKEFNRQLPQKIAKLDIDSADLDEVIKIFGKPIKYVWGPKTLDSDNLPERFILVYPSAFRVFMSEGHIVEIRHERGAKYVFKDKLRIGSSMEEVFAMLGHPKKIVEGEEIDWQNSDGVLFKDIEGRKGHCYYRRSDHNVRLWFGDYKIAAIYMTRSDYGDSSSSGPFDPEFARLLPGRIAQFDIDTADMEKVIELFGEPLKYVWSNETFNKDNLPENYIMDYPCDFSVWLKSNKIMEIRHGPGAKYVFADKLRIGSTMDEALEVLGRPDEIVRGEENEFKDKVLYRDIEGRKGHCYYHRADQNVRLWFSNDKVFAIYMTRSDFPSR